ncbi:M28 family peptidase [Flavobacterium sp.]|uniref:M28 family peptidase n=1 Tax=Flavobacterium sp. TaxID=239 RepID=UPI0026337205|nr:M28 family peptidase [Flavobacterium sp.]
MKKNYTNLFESFFLIGVISLLFYLMMPQSNEVNEPATLTEFSTQRALDKVKIIAKHPHYVGSIDHSRVQNYLFETLKKLGLKPQIQRGFTMTEKGTLVESTNILARIKGTQNGKSLLLLSHYDSAPHTKSHGASDDASGVATILEGIRAYLQARTPHKNDIIILFSDAEELGLNGAALFVTRHPWAKDIGVVLNFEARGSSGPSYMLMETNQGNQNMVKAFQAAGVEYPVTNSLLYSIYKMLPNDTDLTVFRKEGQIQGYNFAFIDSHYNYHTSQDYFENLAPQSLAHQGSYLMPLLSYFANTDLSNLNSSNDSVYFNLPFGGFFHYPFEWILPMLIVAGVLLLGFTFIGLGKHVLQLDEIIKGFLPLIGALLFAVFLGIVGWWLIKLAYPDYSTILQGFPYNGHDYVYAFIAITLGFCFLFYQKETTRYTPMNRLVAALFLWLLINIGIAFQLKGAAFLVIPLLCSTLMLGIYVTTQQSNRIWNLILAIPTLLIIVPFITMFPVGLGLKMLPGSAVLTVLVFVLLLPILGSFTHKKVWATLSLVLGVCFLIKAHFEAPFTHNKAKPNSLLYVFDADKQKAYWTTYDDHLDTWTSKFLGEKPQKAEVLNHNQLYSKYGNAFRWMNHAPIKALVQPEITFECDSTSGKNHYYQIRITPKRKVNRYDIFVKNGVAIQHLKANGVTALAHGNKIGGGKSNKILSYYVTRNQPLVFSFVVSQGKIPQLELMESSFDLLENPLFKIPKRLKTQMPKPFVLNDAVVIVNKIKPILKQNSTP